jgi:flagellar biosynthesis chaperone FliJ
MPRDPIPSGPDVNRLMVPEELLTQLHEATGRLQSARKRFEEAMDETALMGRHGQQVEERLIDYRKTQSELEEISTKIKEILARNP